MPRPAIGIAVIAAALALLPLAPAAGAGKPEHAGKGGRSAQSDTPGHGKGGGPKRGSGAGERAIEAAITAAASMLIHEYFAGSLPAGYLRPEPLPPGIARNLARGKPLPPGIARKQLPGPLLAQLPHYEGHRYYAVGRDVVLVAVATGIVVDILTDAL